MPKPKTNSKPEPQNTVVVSLALPKKLFDRIERYKTERGFATSQEVARVGMTDFLNRNGY